MALQDDDNLNTYWFMLLFIPIYMVIWVSLLALLRRYAKLHWFCFVVIPIILLPIYIFVIPLNGWFRWIKRLSVLVGILIINSMRYHESFISQRMQTQMKCLWNALPALGAVVLAINILEAMIKEYTIISDSSQFVFPGNIITGFCLIITLSSFKTIWVFDTQSTSNTERRDNINECPHSKQYLQTMFDRYKAHNILIYDFGLFWVITYSVWNITFAFNFACYRILPAYSLHIGVPLLMLIYCPIGEWLELRAYALMLSLYFTGTEFVYYIPFLNLPACEVYAPAPISKTIFSVISFIVGLSIVFYQIYCRLYPEREGIILRNSIIQSLIGRCIKNDKKSMPLELRTHDKLSEIVPEENSAVPSTVKSVTD